MPVAERADDAVIFPVALGKPDVRQMAIAELTSGHRIRIEALINEQIGAKYLDQEVVACGWAKTVRKQGGGRVFIELNDGSTCQNLQIIVDTKAVLTEETKSTVTKAGVATSFRVCGKLVKSPKEGQSFELLVEDPSKHHIKVLGDSDQSKYPLAKKAHSKEYLRDIQHLRPRSYLFSTVMRLRSAVAFALHEFYQARGFTYIHTPLITASDCEGAGEMFQVTTLLPESKKISDLPTDEKTGEINFKRDFFMKPANLTVSGQLALESFACSMGDTYTFGPAFRAELSHTNRHLAEFWMVEPEMAFADLEDLMECAESCLRYCVQYVLNNRADDLKWLDSHGDGELINRLQSVAESHFQKCAYTEAIEILKESYVDEEGKRPEENEIFWGMDLGSLHERFICEKHFKKPVIVYDYPYELKAFYMKVNPDGKTVRAMDILVPAVGEIIGGSQREDNLELLDKQIKDKGLNVEDYWWYRELRQYGSVPHSGFGLGFERLVMMVTGVDNIRDVIPFPRYPGACEF